MTERKDSPPPEVLTYFNISSSATPLAGGQGESWVADQIVLKPAEDSDLSQRTCEIQRALYNDQTGYRVAQPIEREGRFVFNGWTATRFISGAEDLNLYARLPEIMEASRAMHRALAKIVPERPTILSNLTHRWAYADRFAWDEPLNDISLDSNFYKSQIEGYITRLNALKRELPDVSCQLVHGDLSGNILFEQGSYPAILDFSFYWRPVEYAEAIVLADGMTWQNFDIQAVKSIGWNAFRFQMLLRALIFRIVTYAIDLDEAFVAANWGQMNAEHAVKIMEDNRL